jgi:hypothetical protein
MSKVAGTCTFTVNGVLYALRGNMNIAIGNVHRESITGLDGYHGFKEVPEAGMIECDVTDMGNTDYNVLEQLTNVTVTVKLINNNVATLNNATQMNHLSLNAEDGKLTLKFEGPSGTWQINQQTAAAQAS